MSPHSNRSRSFLDIQNYLADDILQKVDRATMSVGLEARAPFLTREVAHFALGCSFGELAPGKQILKEAVKDLLPPPILN